MRSLGIDRTGMQAALEAVDLTETSDAAPAPQSVVITIGETTTVIADADVAAALHQLSAEQLRALLIGAVGPDHGRSAD